MCVTSSAPGWGGGGGGWGGLPEKQEKSVSIKLINVPRKICDTR